MFNPFKPKSLEERLRPLIKEVVSQGGQEQKIIALFKVLKEEFDREYYNDNDVARRITLMEWLLKSFKPRGDR